MSAVTMRRRNNQNVKKPWVCMYTIYVFTNQTGDEPQKHVSPGYNRNMYIPRCSKKFKKLLFLERVERPKAHINGAMTLLADAACHPQLRDACVPPPQVLLREHRLHLGQNFLVCAIFCCNIAKTKKMAPAIFIIYIISL